jgi:hypothetical protein
MIAEIGSNHNRDLDLAYKMIEAAAQAGVDAVKFQPFKADDLYSKKTPGFAYLNNTNSYELIRLLELNRNVCVFLEFAKTYDRDGSTTAALKANRYSLLALQGTALMAVPGFFMVNYATERFFPKYLPTRELIPLFLLMASLCVADFWSSYLVIGRQERLLH